MYTHDFGTVFIGSPWDYDIPAYHVIFQETVAALVIGENVGTTITALLASLGATTNARRAAYFHVLQPHRSILDHSCFSLVYPACSVDYSCRCFKRGGGRWFRYVSKYTTSNCCDSAYLTSSTSYYLFHLLACSCVSLSRLCHRGNQREIRLTGLDMDAGESSVSY